MRPLRSFLPCTGLAAARERGWLMKTRTRLLLERRFREWAGGTTFAALSAAVLLGLTLSSTAAEAQDSVCFYGGYGGPTIAVFINDSPVASLVADPVTHIVNLEGDYTSGTTRFSIAGAADGFSPSAYVDQGTGVS